MKPRARKAKAKNMTDVTQPTRRPTSAYIKQLMAKYHREVVAPLQARLAMVETLLAEVCEVQDGRIVFRNGTGSVQVIPDSGIPTVDLQP